MKNHFKAMWSKVESEYRRGNICSERHLQAVIFHHLVSNFEFSNKYKIRVEPKIYDVDNRLTTYNIVGKIPDMIITKDDEIIAVVEIKFVPHHYVPFEKDIENLAKFWSLKSDEDTRLLLDVMPHSGDWNPINRYKISQDLYIIFCAIGNIDSYIFQENNEVWSEKYTKIKEPINRLFLSGIINKDTQTFSMKADLI